METNEKEKTMNLYNLLKRKSEKPSSWILTFLKNIYFTIRQEL